MPRKWCQTDEDWIIDSILKPIGLLQPGQTAVDLGAWDGFYLSNVRHLQKRHGFALKLFDGDGHHNPEVIRTWITAENVVSVLREHGVPTEPAVMSIDLDGNDYWIRRAIGTEFRPALIVQEFNGTLDPLVPVTIPYDSGWSWRDGEGSYYGCSWSALKQLNESFGYTYVRQCGCLNAFFVRSDLLGSPATAKLPWNPDPPPIARYHRYVEGTWQQV